MLLTSKSHGISGLSTLNERAGLVCIGQFKDWWISAYLTRFFRAVLLSNPMTVLASDLFYNAYLQVLTLCSSNSCKSKLPTKTIVLLNNINRILFNHSTIT